MNAVLLTEYYLSPSDAFRCRISLCKLEWTSFFAENLQNKLSKCVNIKIVLGVLASLKMLLEFFVVVTADSI